MRGLIATVFRKELKDHLRDRRSVLTSLLTGMAGPLITLAMFSLVASWSRQDKVLEVPVIGREHAPSLMAFLARNGATLQEAPADHESLIRAGKLDLVLVVPQDYGKSFSSGHTADVSLVVDSSRQSARATVQRARRLLEGYSQMVATQRLIARGVAPELARPVLVEDLDLSTPERAAAMMLNMVPLFLMMMAFTGGLQVASDTMAGERERGSLEPLLLNPASHGAIVVGKWLTTVSFAAASMLVTLGVFVLVVRQLPLEDVGVKARFDGAAILGMVVAILPLAFGASALQMWVSTYARSFKEAQTSLSLLAMAPTLPGLLLSMSPMQAKAWMFAVPALGQGLLAGEVMRGESLGPVPFLIAIVSNIALALVALAATTRLLSQERIVFGRS